MAFTHGFNAEVVSACARNVNNSYAHLRRGLGDTMQNSFIAPMANEWAAKNAQDYFRDRVKPTVDDLVKNVSNIFNSVVSTIDQEGRNWANSSGDGAVYAPVAFEEQSNTIDTSVIQENIGGERGVNIPAAPNVCNSGLAAVMSEVEGALSELVSAASNSGFSNTNVQSALDGSANSIRNNVQNAIESMKQSITSYIDATSSEYGDLAAGSASRLSGE